jgi:Xaa-Pro aminopeptidase
VGHGIGIELYDRPLISPGEDTLLESSMVINIETPYYELKFGGVQVEDCLLITDNGYQPFNKSTHELVRL